MRGGPVSCHVTVLCYSRDIQQVLARANSMLYNPPPPASLLVHICFFALDRLDSDLLDVSAMSTSELDQFNAIEATEGAIHIINIDS